MGTDHVRATVALRGTGIERDLSAFQQTILAVLSDEARYGLAIKRKLEAYYGSDVNHGRLYPNLDDLVAMNLVEKSERDKRTNEYALTEAGADTIVNQLAWVCSRSSPMRSVPMKSDNSSMTHSSSSDHSRE